MLRWVSTGGEKGPWSETASATIGARARRLAPRMTHKEDDVMDPAKFVMDTVMTVAAHFAQRGVAITVEKAKDIIDSVCEKNPALRGQIDVDEMARKIEESAGNVGRVAYNEDTLARFLEIPVADLGGVKPETVEMGVLYDHVRLEGQFREWLEEWGYEVELGAPLVGLRGIEFVPDVYGVLNTLHGQFEVCLNFVCDNPPDENRVFALLGKIEAYAEAKPSFSHGDIFAVTSPHRFTQGALNAIGLQNEQEDYSVLALDGGDVYVLENARSGKDRRDEFQDKVKEAEEETRQSKIRRAAHESR